MTTRNRWRWGLAIAVVAGTAALGRQAAWFLAPLSWTGEATGLAAALGVAAGARVADVGAGDGAMAEAMSALVGPGGRVYATEITAAQVAALAAFQSRRGLTNLEVVSARPEDTGLVDGCCDAVYLRHVFHHVDDRAAMAARLARAVVPGGRIAVIDVAPGGLWFHGASHGVSPDQVREAFERAGWRLRERRDDWGGGTFLVVFEPSAR
jgi:ubiquinone/menaquinone biosynthesis C-methylase UbiE